MSCGCWWRFHNATFPDQTDFLSIPLLNSCISVVHIFERRIGRALSETCMELPLCRGDCTMSTMSAWPTGEAAAHVRNATPHCFTRAELTILPLISKSVAVNPFKDKIQDIFRILVYIFSAMSLLVQWIKEPQSVKRQATGWKTWVRLLAGARIFAFATTSRSTPLPCLVGNGEVVVRRLERDFLPFTFTWCRD